MKLSETSLEFAKTHIENYYDSDFFFKQFEFICIWSNWDEIKKYMLNLDISSFPCCPPYILVVPKQRGGYRIVHQLDPINTILYTALAFLIAEGVESSRQPQENKVACAYRINIGDRGNFFALENGWNEYNSRLIELANENEYVLMTDITDFYNHIYLHRLQNSLERCESSYHGISREIERYLMLLNNKNSRGIPVGPSASIILAEATLIDIDEYILSKNKNYTRYVDDFHIFSNDKDSLEYLLQNLTEYVYKSHRFNLSNHKTRIISSQKFLETYIYAPIIEEKNTMYEELSRYFRSTYHGPQPIEDITELSDKQQFTVKARMLMKLMDKACNMKPIDFALIEKIIRNAKQIGARSIMNIIIDNYENLGPVMREVVLYLNKITNKTVIEQYHEDFTQIIQKSSIIKYSYVRYWMSYYFLENPGYFAYTPIQRFIQNSEDIRLKAIYAKITNNESWVRDYKDRIHNCAPQDRRAILYSATALSSGERKYWMDTIISSGDIVDKSIAKHVMNHK